MREALEDLRARLKTEWAGKTIHLGHGAGGKQMDELIARIITPLFGMTGGALEDAARLDIGKQGAGRLAMTTDSYVVTPLQFPGASIGHLAVNGTVNDLAVSGAQPLYLSCGLIMEEGLAIETLIDVLGDMAEAARKAGVRIVTGDTKVVDRGHADGLFINTAGVGWVPAGVDVGIHRVQPGDKLILSGPLGEHGAAILIARGELALESEIQSDCQPLHQLIAAMLEAGGVHAMRDVTRGGLGSVANEFAEGSGLGLMLDEAAIPVPLEVHGFCEVLGLDVLYLANEGKLLAAVSPESADTVLDAMKSLPEGEQAAVIGEVVADNPGRVVVKTSFGSHRILDKLVGEQLPRIC
jgi:hydrogenase expression/formation protein HypE